MYILHCPHLYDGNIEFVKRENIFYIIPGSHEVYIKIVEPSSRHRNCEAIGLARALKICIVKSLQFWQHLP